MRASAISSTDVLFADSVHWEKRRCFLVTFCHRTKSYPLLGAEALALKHQHQKQSHWIPAFAGMTSPELFALGSFRTPLKLIEKIYRPPQMRNHDRPTNNQPDTEYLEEL